ncbi:hypothetical protein PPERSA_07443 [Pseudocohnilembus persalinus]|uniref:Uncharacterized protein n=1 Tax=Pseudocohnilembus persalinus TaxID=266149 RepID=A0A0V0QAI8_PSEPJ|nr:hypothetical protein PPERSA_07443 [Pseudocohnilembus persalinus]|eukprot:KRW99200.1 hypothetical protein PPERSA_07443 [Pseudocohnilembus persalinus]
MTNLFGISSLQVLGILILYLNLVNELEKALWSIEWYNKVLLYYVCESGKGLWICTISRQVAAKFLTFKFIFPAQQKQFFTKRTTELQARTLSQHLEILMFLNMGNYILTMLYGQKNFLLKSWQEPSRPFCETLQLEQDIDFAFKLNE